MTNDSSRGGRIDVGGNASNSALLVGDQNTLTFQVTTNDLPPPSDVDIRASLDAIAAALANLGSPEQRKIDNAAGEAADEAKKTVPDKNEIDKALGRALDNAKKVAGFVHVVDGIRPQLLGVVAWLGSSARYVAQALGIG
jgi:hypothetical protein